MNTALAVAPYVILPHFVTVDEIGLFAIAHRLVSVTGTILAGLTAHFGPLFAKHGAAGNTATFMRTFRRSQIYSLAFYLPFFLVYAVLADAVLGVFGPEFRTAKVMLLILAYSRLINSTLGLSGLALNMTGRESWELANATVTLVLFAVLCFAPLHLSGGLRVAAAYAIALTCRSILSFILVCSAFGSRSNVGFATGGRYGG